MKIGEKIRIMRKQEGLGVQEFADMFGLSRNSLGNYENRGNDPKGTLLQEITNHPQFRKYTLWLMLDDTTIEYEEEQRLSLDEFDSMVRRLNNDELEQLKTYTKFIISSREENKER